MKDSFIPWFKTLNMRSSQLLRIADQLLIILTDVFKVLN